MALAAITQISKDGIVDSLAAAVTNFQVDCSNGRTFVEVLNGSASSINVTIVTPGTDADGNAIADKIIAVAAAARKKIWLNPAAYGPQADVTLSAITTVTAAVYSV